jgi:diguanylate cyclase (GGDEF)-like protein
VNAKRVYGLVRAASLLTALAVGLSCAWGALARLRSDDVVFLGGAAAFAIVLGALRAPGPRHRLRLLIPVLLVVLAREGWLWASLCAGLAEFTRGLLARRSASRVLLDAAVRIPPVLAAAPLVPLLQKAANDSPNSPGVAAFVALSIAYVVLVELLWFDPLVALRNRRALPVIWLRRTREAPALLTVALGAAWAYVAARVADSEGAILGVSLLTPVAIVGGLVVCNLRLQTRVRRLALSEAAVDAMLRAGDPRPQIRLLLESIDRRIVRESIEVAAFGRGGSDRWSRLLRLGPAVNAELSRLGGRALQHLQAGEEDAVLESRGAGVVRGFIARDADGVLRGALIVFRPAGSREKVATRVLERAASELGPLLRRYDVIAATRSAATIDTLTGLPNRRALAHAFEEAMAYVRGGGRYAVLLLDLDHFKTINDSLGHQTGDRALAAVGRIIAENIRGVDLAGRFGGEEFLVLLRDASRDRAMQIAERLRTEIASSGLTYADGMPLTVSVGVTYAGLGDVAHDVVERADRALYRAKNAGRNRVIESPLLA